MNFGLTMNANAGQSTHTTCTAGIASNCSTVSAGSHCASNTTVTAGASSAANTATRICGVAATAGSETHARTRALKKNYETIHENSSHQNPLVVARLELPIQALRALDGKESRPLSRLGHGQAHAARQDDGPDGQPQTPRILPHGRFTKRNPPITQGR